MTQPKPTSQAPKAAATAVRDALHAIAGPGRARCGACRRRVGSRESVRVQGKVYHRGCAFYRPRRARA